ncbi:MAG: hypothetical protein ACRDRI_26235 [Pseudonocardiaceae bacterium]
MKTSTAALIALVATALLGGLTGCSSKGSNTTCSEYRSMSTQDKRTTVTNLMKDHGETNPSPAKVDITRGSVTAYCFLHSGDNKISSIYTG